jgi:hypothetical protein
MIAACWGFGFEGEGSVERGLGFGLEGFGFEGEGSVERGVGFGLEG